jgi:UDP-4-amino-4,6-dideoxy-N-acetyl-beta-L-altrosamine N-acetyltransferase
MNVPSSDDIGYLRDLHLNDLSLILEWRNSPKVRKNMYSQHEITIKEHLKWWEKYQKSEDCKYLIYENDSKPSGFVSFNSIDKIHKTAFWAFYSAPAAQKGTGTKMEVLALDYCFSTLGLNKLYCEVLEFNKAVLGLHKKFGFVEEGFLEQQYRIGSETFGIYRLAINSMRWLSRPLD